jgi:hypothetical protein
LPGFRTYRRRLRRACVGLANVGERQVPEQLLVLLGNAEFANVQQRWNERMPFVLLCGDRFGLVSVFRLPIELSPSTLFFDGGLPNLRAPLGLFSEGFLSAISALLFLLLAAFGDPPFLRPR